MDHVKAIAVGAVVLAILFGIGLLIVDFHLELVTVWVVGTVCFIGCCWCAGSAVMTLV